MAKPIKTWVEMSQGYIYDHKKLPIDATLFLNRCEVRVTSKGQVLTRQVFVKSLEADNMDALQNQIGDFITRDDVRLLRKGLEANDFKRLPGRVTNPPQDVLDGTAAIYHAEEE